MIKLPFKYSAERLYRKDNTYDIILVLNYNCNPVRKGRGSAIFIHVARKNYSSTLGCIGVSKRDLKKIIKKINKDKYYYKHLSEDDINTLHESFQILDSIMFLLCLAYQTV